MALGQLDGRQRTEHQRENGMEPHHKETQICHHVQNMESPLHPIHPVTGSLGIRASCAHHQKMVLDPCLSVVSGVVPSNVYSGTKPEKTNNNVIYMM